MNTRERIQLWNWINEYVVACGGDPSDATVSVRRMEAVVRIEATVTEVLNRLLTEAFPPIRVMAVPCEPSLIDLPENPTIQSTEEARQQVSDALADWIMRGNMRHEDKPDPRLPTPEELLTAEEIEGERIKVLGRTPEEIEEERSKVMAEAKERAAKLARATVEEQLEFVKKAVELGCLKYIGDPTYVGTFPERQDIPVEPKAPHPEKKVEPGVLSGTFSKVLEAVYRSDAPDDVVYEVVGNLLRAGITEPTPEDVEAMFRSVLNRRKDP